VSRSSIPARLRLEVQTRDQGRCSWCRLAQRGQGATYHVDHIRPRSRGGSTTLENLALQCPSCSLRKADKIDAIDPTTGDSVPLFHPLLQNWEDHFRLADDGTCEGLSSVGRATVDALGMNLPAPRLARAYQLALGLLSTRASG
jgi:hypothetical protein